MLQFKDKKVNANRIRGIRHGAPMTKEDLEMAAYFHWLGRGCPSDDALSDWIEVEKKWGGDSVSEKMDVQA